MSFSSCLFPTYGTEPVPHVFDKKMPTVPFIFQITDALKGIADHRSFFTCARRSQNAHKIKDKTT